MTREIKFRAWDGKEMWTGFEFVPIDIIVPPAWKKTANKNMTWMQYTGLKDRSGKEIYEGDIWKYEDYLHEVEWVSGGFYPREWDDVWFGEWEVGEVIGNIYENKELLNAD